MRRFHVIKLCQLLLALFPFSITEWVEISQSQTRPVGNQGSTKQLGKDIEEVFTTPSAVWIEYQRERFGLSQSNSNSHSNPFIVSDAGGLKNSAQIVVPNNSQVIHARTKLVVNKSTDMPQVDFGVVLPPKVETTSRRHSSYVESAEDADAVVETATEPSGSDAQAEDDGQLQLPSMQGFLKFLKSMQSTWITKSSLNLQNKIQLLKRLRDNLMKVIEQQFSVLWQPTERHRRRRRGLLDESNLEFPPEAALMSINFLTFAVFLIKLVLQVVKIVKSKHYNFSGFNINAEAVRNP
ncbi:uncharacterized protein LOC6563180 [Drosophila grimshawi]|uniref:GH19236 n=1 Tax=Drosophila grimshawi TaxID=7222 RepID=B4JF31_DROGR|nr:uncharacterized protein LOC6563180 [Drosophila grimshawi]EDV93312.1 GH19236 [Drosophila grimshawi]